MSLIVQIAQLRHAYSHLKAERVTKQAQFADGLISPIIKALEKIQKEIDDESRDIRRTGFP